MPTPTSATQYYKVLDKDGCACHGGSGQWLVPVNGEPGPWMPAIQPRLCKSGYHVVPASALLDWLDADDQQIWTAEIRGVLESSPDKIAAESARLVTRLRWDAQIARAFACDCAEHVLPLFETRHPQDLRPRDAIAVARRYLRGATTLDELAAAGDAARGAAWAAARAAAWAAARDAAWAAARAAVWDAARDAAWAAVWDAARDAERQWQTARLLAYVTGEVHP